jgi:glutamate synthase domain-containing protein 2
VLGRGGDDAAERDLLDQVVLQIIQSRYGPNPHHLMLADGIEVLRSSARAARSARRHLMGQKVTEQVAEMRSLPPGIDQRSPAPATRLAGPDDLR